jgi:MFS superfamily sulfate permease-like transporter
MLVYTGARLASPAELRHVMKVGNDQLLLFLTTLVVTLATDLLVGVASGLALKIILHWVRGASPRSWTRKAVDRDESEGVLRLTIRGPAVFPRLLWVRSAVASIGPDCKKVVIDLSQATLVDHTFLSGVDTLAGELNAPLVIEGLDRMHAISSHPHATRRRVA